MRERFIFKQFEVSHSKSSMPVGLDSILLGAWVSLRSEMKILDVGTGCGLLALMCAQRSPHSEILAIDIDGDSIKEAGENFHDSKWSNRLLIIQNDFISFKENDFDLLISNPPFFKSGLNNPCNARELARHESALSPITLLSHGRSLLKKYGRIAMVVPTNRKTEIELVANSYGHELQRVLYILPRPNLMSKRVLLDFCYLGKEGDSHHVSTKTCKEESLILYTMDNQPTEAFVSLCKDFYLKF